MSGPRLAKTISSHRLAWLTLGALALLLVWDASGLDLAFARRMGTTSGFPLREDPLLRGAMHEGARVLGIAGAVALWLAIRWPLGPMKSISTGRRLQLAAGTTIALLAVPALKSFSATSCPWDLSVFGGAADYVSHWNWLQRDGGSGHCFPAGHAALGFAFCAGYFAFRRDAPSVARRWLAGSLIAGFALGLSQQWRGAHFMSHTLWTAWLCWSIVFALDAACDRAFLAGRAAGVPTTIA